MKFKTAFKLSALVAAMSFTSLSNASTSNDWYWTGSNWQEAFNNGWMDPADYQYVDVGSGLTNKDIISGSETSRPVNVQHHIIDGKNYYLVDDAAYQKDPTNGQLLIPDLTIDLKEFTKDTFQRGGTSDNYIANGYQQDEEIKRVDSSNVTYGSVTIETTGAITADVAVTTSKEQTEAFKIDLKGSSQSLESDKVVLGIIDKNGDKYGVYAEKVDTQGNSSSTVLTASGITTTGTIKINGENVATEILVAASDAAVLASANEYTDTKAVETLASANEYTDTKAVETLASANEYTDTKAVETLASANEYTDTKAVETLASANEYTDTKAVETLASANVYTDTKAVETLTSANVYTDVTVQLLRDGATAESARLDQAVVTSQETSRYYTDTKATETLTAAQDFAKAEDAKTLEAAKAEDVKVLASANAYTDAQIGAFGSTAARLNKRINDVEETAYRGIAIALAAQQQIPNIGAGQFAVFGGVGHYEGESAGALGLAGVLADGRTSLSAALGAAGNGEVGGRVGVAYVFGGK